MAVVRSPVRSVVRSPVRGVFGGVASLLDDATSYLNGVAPFHYADFISNRMLYAGADVGTVAGGTGYTFTRASQGYYTNSDGTLTLFGHNLLLRSQEFDNASWTKTRATVTANAVAAPDGTLTAEKLVEDSTASNSHFIAQSPTLTAAAHTFTVYAKAAERSYIGLFIGTVGVGKYFDLANGAVLGNLVGAPTSAAIEALGNGWYRCSIVFTGTAAPNAASVYLSPDGTSISYNGDNASGAYIWGAQLEAGSTATTYLPTTSAAVSALRRGDRGVLIEGARTNLLLRSQEFDNASWSKTATGTGVAPTVTANQGVAPDGTTTADRVQFSLGGGTASGDISRLDQTVTVVAATAYRNTVWIRSNTASTYVMELDISGGAARTVITVTPDWQRFESPFTMVGTSTQARIGLRGSGATQNSDTADVLIWGAQLEAASFPSSYIPTTTTSAIRQADVLTYTAGVSYPIRLWSEFERAVDTGGIEVQLQVDNGSNNDSANLTVNSTDTLRTFITTGGAVQADQQSAATIAVNATTKAALRVATNDTKNALNGTLTTADTGVTLPATPTTLRIGRSDLPPFGYIRRIAVIQGAGTDADLIAMTT